MRLYIRGKPKRTENRHSGDSISKHSTPKHNFLLHIQIYQYISSKTESRAPSDPHDYKPSLIMTTTTAIL